MNERKAAPTQRIPDYAGRLEIKKRLESCRNCGGMLPLNRRSFCSGTRATVRRMKGGMFQIRRDGDGCVHDWMLRTQPLYARAHVWVRDRGVCALCRQTVVEWQADHIVPVVEGGADLGLKNLRTLCTACHKGETAKLAGRRRAV